MIGRKKAIGRRGSWFAAIGDEPALPCVHKHWMRRLDYDDPFADMRDPVWQEFVAAIMDRRQVILTQDEVTPSGAEGKPPGFRRLGYVASYGVDDVRIEDTHLKFRFVKRLNELD